MSQPYGVSIPSQVTSARRSPSLAALVELFLRPGRFFRSVDLGRGSSWLLAIVIVGVSTSISKVDQNLIRADLGQARPGWEGLAPYLLESWRGFWLFVIISGLVAAVFAWYLGGWWYNVRLGWSGATNIDKREGRLVYTFAGLVGAIPAVAYVLIQTAVHANYQAAWDADEPLAVLLIAFPFWAVMASYAGVRARFAVRAGSARLWFLILPILAYAVAFGLIGTLYGLMSPGGPEGVSV